MSPSRLWEPSRSEGSHNLSYAIAILNNRTRRITHHECARLQCFPDSYIIHPDDNSAYKQLGNAVSVPVIKTILENLIKHNNLKEVMLNIAILDDFTRRRWVKSSTRDSLHLANDSN